MKGCVLENFSKSRSGIELKETKSDSYWRNLGAREGVRESRHSKKCLFPEEPYDGPREGAVSYSEVPLDVTDPSEMRCLSAQGYLASQKRPPPP